jgi:hypothetical protein
LNNPEANAREIRANFTASHGLDARLEREEADWLSDGRDRTVHPEAREYAVDSLRRYADQNRGPLAHPPTLSVGVALSRAVLAAQRPAAVAQADRLVDARRRELDRSGPAKTDPRPELAREMAGMLAETVRFEPFRARVAVMLVPDGLVRADLHELADTAIAQRVLSDALAAAKTKAVRWNA